MKFIKTHIVANAIMLLPAATVLIWKAGLLLLEGGLGVCLCYIGNETIVKPIKSKLWKIQD